MKFCFLLLVILQCGSLLYGNDEKYAAARELLIVSGVPETLERAFAAQLENILKSAPELEKHRKSLSEFYRKNFSFKELEQDLCNLYSKYYTVDEMRQLTAFYRTPVGRKKAETDGILSRDLGNIFNHHSAKKLPELQKLLKKISEEK